MQQNSEQAKKKLSEDIVDLCKKSGVEVEGIIIKQKKKEEKPEPQKLEDIKKKEVDEIVAKIKSDIPKSSLEAMSSCLSKIMDYAMEKMVKCVVEKGNFEMKIDDTKEGMIIQIK